MNLEVFIKALEEMKPSEELLIRNGFTDLPEDILKNFVLDKKAEAKDLKQGLIFQLFDSYDPQFLRFADYSFYKEIEEHNGVFVFCRSSYSLLVFQNIDSEVIEKDTDEFSLLNYCAKDTSSFLEALLVVFEMDSLRFQGLVSVDDEEANYEFLNRAVKFAGGEKYKRFFNDIINS